MLATIGLLALFSLQESSIEFKKTIVDSRFIAEGVTVGDINRDRKLDILAGNVWYAAPNWTPHEIVPVPTLDPKTQYSNCFNTWSEDLNHDGWVDQILIGMPGEKAIWRENPKGASKPWPEHLIWRSAGNESPLFEDLFSNGKRVLIMGYDDDYLAWFEPARDANAEWICHRISGLKGAGSQRYSHGLGVGDLDGDGRNEVLTKDGYYVGPASSDRPWTFVKTDLGPDCAQMSVLAGGKGMQASVISTSAHGRGVWILTPEKSGGFTRFEIDKKIGQTHAANLVNLGKKKIPNLITGKRKWAHPPGVDIGSEEPSLLVRYELTDSAEFQTWITHIIDSNSGVGTQFVVTDVDGDKLADIVTANKNGVFFFKQLPQSASRR